MLLYHSQHSKCRFDVTNLLNQIIIKVYFPWYQRNDSEKQLVGLQGIPSIKKRLLASSYIHHKKLEINQHLLSSSQYLNLCEACFLWASKGFKMT